MTKKNSPLSALIQSQEILIVCGSGGVGKTTSAAAIAMQAAMVGKRAIVLTIDPAKRLASSMGMEALTDEPTLIQASYFPSPPAGSLHAMMLDTKRTFDRIIEKYAPSAEARQAILENRLYQQMSNMLAGSHEYMAMERLYEIHHDGDFDLVVLDTPPTRNALNFLDAPKKMVSLTRHSVLKWFLKPGLFAGKVSFGIFQKSAEKILSVFDQLAGFSFLHELAEMVSGMADMLGGFGERAEKIYDLLRSSKVSFILVATPEKMALQDARYFHEQIGTYELPFAGFVFNRVYPDYIPSEAAIQEVKTQLKSLPTNIETGLIKNLEDFYLLQKSHRRSIAEFKKICGPKPFYTSVPFLETDVHDMEGLAEINRHLFAQR